MFERGREYQRRTDIHDVYGGNRQSGISIPRSGTLIFLFAAAVGETFGYQDGWIGDDLFRYSGEGQRGDMAFVRGNKRLRDHADTGHEIHLFTRTRSGHYRYHGQFEVAEAEFEERLDVRERPRQAIVFTLRRLTTS